VGLTSNTHFLRNSIVSATQTRATARAIFLNFVLSLMPACLFISQYSNQSALRNPNCSCLHGGRGDHKEPRKGHKKAEIKLKDAEKTHG
jgi:hypothetical protein